MPQGRPVEEETREGVRAAIRTGSARNEVARQFKLSTSTMSKIADDVGLSLDRSGTAAATAARQVGLAAGRARLAEKMLDEIDGTYLGNNFGGKDNDYNEHELESAPVEVKRSIIVTAGITSDKLTRTVERDNDGLEQAQGVLDQLAAGFAAEQYRSETPDAAE